jgi:hypothetical protein
MSSSSVYQGSDGFQLQYVQPEPLWGGQEIFTESVLSYHGSTAPGLPAPQPRLPFNKDKEYGGKDSDSVSHGACLLLTTSAFPSEVANPQSTIEIGPVPLCGQQCQPSLLAGTPPTEIANAKYLHMEHAAAEMVQYAYPRDQYYIQLPRPAAWVESQLLAHELHALHPGLVIEAVYRAIFLGLYIAEDHDSVLFLQNSNDNQVIKRIAQSLPYHSTEEDGHQVIALLRRIF